MIADLKQPAQIWLGDVLNNFVTLLDAGDDPSVIIEISGIEIEIRLKKIAGGFERVMVPVVVSEGKHG